MCCARGCAVGSIKRGRATLTVFSNFSFFFGELRTAFTISLIRWTIDALSISSSKSLFSSKSSPNHRRLQQCYQCPSCQQSQHHECCGPKFVVPPAKLNTWPVQSKICSDSLNEGILVFISLAIVRLFDALSAVTPKSLSYSLKSVKVVRMLLARLTPVCDPFSSTASIINSFNT